MDYERIRVPFEKEMGERLFELLEGDIIEKIIKDAKVEELENQWKYILEGHSFKVTKELAPKLFDLFTEVHNKLEFNEKTDFYITNSAELNAFAISRVDENYNHIININSELLERMDDDEIRFIIGHETGHLISNNARITKLIQFLFPDLNDIPLLLRHWIELWEKISELTADRFGYLASPNLEKCITGFFKISSGVDLKRITFDADAYMEENDKILDYFKNNNGQNLLSHPINPIRLKALQIFSKRNDNDLNEEQGSEIDNLTSILMTLTSSEIDYHRSLFIAAGGIFVAGLDKNINNDEYKKILSVLSNNIMFPKRYLSDMAKDQKLNEVMMDSVEYLLNTNPGERYTMFEYMVGVALADKTIEEVEINFLYDFGQKVFGFSAKETAQIIAGIIRKVFVPKVYH